MAYRFNGKQLLTLSEQTRILDALPPRWRVFSEFLLATGLRVQEVITLNVGDLGDDDVLDCPVLKVQKSSTPAEVAARHRKAGRGLTPEDVHERRRYPLNSRAIRLFREMAGDRGPDEPIMPGKSWNGRISRKTLEAVWRVTLRELGLRPEGSRPTPHSCRHTCGTRVTRAKGIWHAQGLLHHSSVKTTEMYTHHQADDVREAAEAADWEDPET